MTESTNMPLSGRTRDFLTKPDNAYFTPSWVPERFREGYSATMLTGADASKKAMLNFVQDYRPSADKHNCVRVHCENVLGGTFKLGDPYKVEINGASSINTMKYRITDLLTPRTTGQKNPHPALLSADAKYGPTLHQFCPLALWEKMMQAAEASGFNMDNMKKIGATFYSKYANTPLFFAMKNSPDCLRCLDANLRENGLTFDYPIVCSPAPLSTAENLVERLMSRTSMDASKDLTDRWAEILSEAKEKMATALQRCLGDQGTACFEDYEVFTTKEGQIVWFTLRQLSDQYILNAASLFESANQVKAFFVQNGSANSQVWAESFQEAFAKANLGAVLTAECGPEQRSAMAQDYLPTDFQVSKDGSVIFLNKNIWKSYQTIPLAIRNRFNEIDREGKAQAILATRKDGSGRDILGACRGSSKDLVEALQQIETFRRMWDALRVTDPTVGLMLGIDANINNEYEKVSLVQFCALLGLEATEADSAQWMVARTSYIITPMEQLVVNKSVVFKKGSVNPNRSMQSDGATLGLNVYSLQKFEYPPVLMRADISADAFIEAVRNAINIEMIFNIWQTPKERRGAVAGALSTLLRGLQDIGGVGLATTNDNRKAVAKAIREFLEGREWALTSENLARIPQEIDFFTSLSTYGLQLDKVETSAWQKGGAFDGILERLEELGLLTSQQNKVTKKPDERKT